MTVAAPCSRARSATPVGPAGAGNSLAKLTATEFMALLEAGEVSAADYARACADVIDQLEPSLSAWAWYDRGRFEDLAVRVDAELARRRASGKAGLQGRAAGVPIGVKDIYNTDDMPTSHGSELFAGYQPGNDARVVTNLRREAAIMAGKTVTAEFAVHTPNGTRNPRDTSRSSGTSSSGSAVAVATAMVPVALASQTAGSIIRPASYCGVLGFKPSYGTIPRTAMLKTTDTLDSVGFMARSVPDLELTFDILRVRGPNYPVVDAAMKDPTRRKPPGRGWRIGVLEGPKSFLIRPAVRESFGSAIDQLVASGCDTRPFVLPPSFAAAHDIHETIYRRSLSYYFRMEWETGKYDFSPGLAAMIEGGTHIDFAEYEAALRAQTALAREFELLAAAFDVVVCPSTADEAPVGLDAPDIPDHCLVFTMCHAPALSLPLLRGTTGLPVGLQVVTRRFGDDDLLGFAAFAFEALG
jgi:Asp-tRNA(Asn)/Glu-tRNA(Gln) amidotransferase A subunit family amidase